jgi:phosphatidylserine decarboxylase
MSIAKEGYKYVVFLAAIGVIGFGFGFPFVGLLFLALALFVLFFFRDPERIFQGGPGKVVSPADGKVVSIRKEGGQDVISIFLSVFDVHINRAPVSGTITDVQYRPGRFLVAFDERASRENEQNSITIEQDGHQLRFVQIAGLIARRIICWRRKGEKLQIGERVGLIQFGSRVDVFFPEGFKVTAQVGHKVKAGETIIGEFS